MNLRRALAGIAVLALCFAIPRTIPADEAFLAGSIDGFALPADPASPSSDLVAAVLATFGAGVLDFDLIAGVNGGTIDTHVAHTFTGLPSGIVGATLELRVRAGNDPFTTSDAIVLSFVDATIPSYLDAVVYGRTLGPYGGPCGVVTCPDPGLVQATPWTSGDDATVTLDLAALPLVGGGTLDLIPDLNSHGFLDVKVADETGVDFMRLTIETADLDTDGDGIGNDSDFCAATVAPEENVPSVRLGTNRWALGQDEDDNLVFVTASPKGKGPKRSYTIEDTAGCSCEQIIEAFDLGKGHTKFGCSTSALDDFVALMKMTRSE